MKIVLKPLPPEATAHLPEGAIVVGQSGAIPVYYLGRRPHIGDREVEHADIAQDLLDAVEDVCGPLFGGDWLKPLAVVSGLNVRTVQRDRILKFGLPAGVLRALGEARSVAVGDESARAVGHIMQGVALIAKSGRSGGWGGYKDASATDELKMGAQMALDAAIPLVRAMLKAPARQSPI